MNDIAKDEYWLKQAIGLAQRAEAAGEVPVGAVLVLDNKLVAEGWNQPISGCDPTAHAEVITLRNAAKALGNYRLINTTLYCTLEPCVMCLGAIIHARVQRLVYGADDPKAGALKSAFNLLATRRFNHHLEWSSGLLQKECAALLTNFFSKRRQAQNATKPL